MSRGGDEALRPGPSFRACLPLLARPDLVWLDHAATTPTAAPAIQALVHHYQMDHGNVHRGLHRQAEAATAAYEGARARVASFLGAPDPRGVIFTSGATAALNLAARGWGGRLGPGDRVVVSALEHHSSLLPWRALARERGATVETLPLDPSSGVDLGVAARALAGASALVLTARSNVLGLAPPVAALCALARGLGVLSVVDAAQAVARDRPDVTGWGCDLLAFSGHKVYGPTGIGALVVRPGVLDAGRPPTWGGGMVALVDDEAEQARPAPWGWEAGTPPIADAVGLAAALDLLRRLDPAEARAWVDGLCARLQDGLAARGDVVILGDLAAPARGGVLSFQVQGVHPHDVAEILASRGVAVRAGDHCAAPLMRRLGHESAVRASLGPANTAADVDALLHGLDAVREVFPR